MTASDLIKKKPRPRKPSAGDLYSVLGVARDATTEEIRAAFRNLMRQHHPDMNGGVQSPEFNLIKEAYDVLVDHMARRVYDETGIHPDDKKAKIMAAAIDGLRQCFVMILEQADPDTLERCDLLGSIQKFIDAKTREEKNILAMLNENEKNLRKSQKVIEKRLKCKAEGGVNVFLGVLKARIADIVNKQIPIEAALEVKKEMGRVLKTYEFDWIKDAVPLQRINPSINPSGTTATFNFKL